MRLRWLAWVLLLVPVPGVWAHTSVTSVVPGALDALTEAPLGGPPPIVLESGEEVRIDFGPASAVASLPSGPVRYRRFQMDNDGELVRIAVKVLAQTHDSDPRFTVVAPQLVLLRDDGQIRRIVPLDHLRLDIRPFRTTRLRECIVASHVDSFLLATDPSRLGDYYRFHARSGKGPAPDHGFYQSNAAMEIFLTWADSGPVEVEWQPASEAGSACRRVPD